MRGTMGIFLPLLVIFLLTHTGNALKCYKCTRCNDPFKAKDVDTVECSASCYKAKSDSDKDLIVYKIKKGDVMRGCSTEKTTKCEKSEAFGITGEICTCDKELCNGSNVLKPSVGIGILVVSAVLKDFL